MTDRDLRERLDRVPVPEAGAARERAWAVVADAYADRPPARRRPLRPLLGAAAAVLLALAVATAVTPPGLALGRWVRTVLGGVAPPAPRAALGPLPAGRLLVTSAGGAWIVGPDGGRHRLGDYAGATWSPRGLYVAAWRGHQLSAVAPDGRVAWRIAAPGPVADARWSPDGYRVAYRRGAGLAVIAGDGTSPRLLAARAWAAAPAWRPGRPHTLAWVDAGGRVVVADVDSGRTAWRSATPIGPTSELLWSADGRRLLARGKGVARVVDPSSGRVRPLALGAGARVQAAAWAPAGERIALVERRDGVSRLLVIGRQPTADVRLAVSGRLDSIAWSPHGGRLLVHWRDADEWLVVGVAGRERVVAIGRVSARFAGAPTVRGWCC
jgi:dipeptidyl aminopeptidase/acylaminoacyl peptidase